MVTKKNREPVEELMLYVVATPIGVNSDVSARAIQVLTSCTAIIGEEHKNASKFLKFSGVPQKDIYILNEHSKPDDLEELCRLAKSQDVALVSDCGTPGFCDPGADLVRLCRQRKIRVQSIPGPSSLTSFLSVCGHRLDQFFFRGFLPAENKERARELEKLKASRIATIVMDTPYRLKKLLEEWRALSPRSQLILGLELSTEQEHVLEGTAETILKNLSVEKAEFILLILA
jgi:16S rRNA (cytidine1402-2'-O)-methyltransferase